MRREKQTTSNGSDRSRLLTAGGILSIVAGIFQIGRGASIAVNLRYMLGTVPNWWVIFGGCVGVLGILAVVGGIFAIRRKRFGLSLAGAICALPLYALGVPAVIFICLSKKEFGEERKEDDI